MRFASSLFAITRESTITKAMNNTPKPCLVVTIVNSINEASTQLTNQLTTDTMGCHVLKRSQKYLYKILISKTRILFSYEVTKLSIQGPIKFGAKTFGSYTR